MYKDKYMHMHLHICSNQKKKEKKKFPRQFPDNTLIHFVFLFTIAWAWIWVFRPSSTVKGRTAFEVGFGSLPRDNWVVGKSRVYSMAWTCIKTWTYKFKNHRSYARPARRVPDAVKARMVPVKTRNYPLNLKTFRVCAPVMACEGPGKWCIYAFLIQTSMHVHVAYDHE